MSGKPTGGSIRWNVVFLALEGCLICSAHFIVGVSWATLGVGFGGVLAFGIALITYVVKVNTPRRIRRHQALLQSYQAAANGPRHLIQEAASARREDIDGASAPYVTPASPTAEASRAR